MIQMIHLLNKARKYHLGEKEVKSYPRRHEGGAPTLRSYMVQDGTGHVWLLSACHVASTVWNIPTVTACSRGLGL